MDRFQYLAFLDKWECSHRMAADLLGVNLRTSRRWANGQQAIPDEIEDMCARVTAEDIASVREAES